MTLFQSVDLDAGVRLHLRRTKTFKTISARLVFHAPLDDGTAARALVPRVLGRGTRRFPDLRALQTELDRLYGASLSGDTRKLGDRHLVQIRSDWVMDRLAGKPISDEMAALLAEYLHEPAALDDRSVFDQERKMMVDEAESIRDEKGRYAQHRLIEEMCRREAYARPAIGRTDEIRALTPDAPARAHAALLTRGNVDIFLVGDIGMAQARRFAKTLDLAAGRKPIRIPRTARQRPGRVRTVKEPEALAQARLAMGFRTRVRPDSPLLPAMLLMNALFGGTAVGKLFKVVREKESLCYSISSSTERTKGLLLVNAGIDAKHYAKTRRLIVRQLDALREADVEPETMEQGRGMLLSGYRSLFDSPGAMIDFALERIVNRQPPDLDSMLEGVAAVSVRDVARAARGTELDTVYFLGS